MSKVGMTTRAFFDERRANWDETGARPLSTTIWYPAVDGVEEEAVLLGPRGNPLFDAGLAANEAELSPSDDVYPLILLSHGTGGSALQMMWLGRALAAHGFIAACVDHHGNTAAEDKPTPQGFMLWWERPQDLSSVLNELLADPVFGARINTARIGAAGFSLGGYTAIALAGGRLNLQAYEDFCNGPDRDATCEAPPEYEGLLEDFEQLKQSDARVRAALSRHHESYRDPRIGAIFVMAPVGGGAFTLAGLASVRVPVYIVAGNEDAIAPRRTNAQRIAERIDGAQLLVLPGKVGHYTFLCECTDLGRQMLDICRDEQGVDRGGVHAQVSQMAYEFFQRALPFDLID